MFQDSELKGRLAAAPGKQRLGPVDRANIPEVGLEHLFHLFDVDYEQRKERTIPLPREQVGVWSQEPSQTEVNWPSNLFH